MKWSLLAGLGVGTAVGLLYTQGKRLGAAERTSFERTRPRMQSTRDHQAEPAHSSHPHSFLAIINEWPHSRLIEIHGIGPVLAARIISHRPYRTAQELVDAKLLPPSAIAALQKVS